MVEMYGIDDYIWTDADASLRSHWYNGLEVLENIPLAVVVSDTSFYADGDAEVVFSGLPVPCEISINNDIITVTDGTLELGADEPDTFHVVIDEVGYTRQEWVIDAI
jgi:hypothetical protein